MESLGQRARSQRSMSQAHLSTPVPKPSPWPARFAFGAWLCAIPLLIAGGTVTSLDAGMAIDGWFVLEPGRGDHFILFYPIEKWFRDVGTFFEHSHRLLGMLVGNFAIAAVVATWMTTKLKASRRAALAALLIVCVQGLVGGTRVLENSPQLAFLHGALAQIVFSVLAYAAVVLAPKYIASSEDTSAESRALSRSTWITVLIVYLTIFAGAWLRHAFSHGALGVHILAVIAATVAIFASCKKFKQHAAQFPGKSPLRRAALSLHLLLGIQLLLGMASFWIVVMIAPQGSPEVHHSAYPTSHVLFGALVLAQLVVARAWTRRCLANPGGQAASPMEALSS
jgi:cytochrome c oxidase assembly protein subunit 15